eukprot:TRINITY_DN16986_c0_g1_i1.p1 TRINITY_DN16986_c0_g1~~TRINITY_DN16986_c0_g1_i1.p1  ORF type:complete len:521 (-),score=87.32 TRINITY_DN16986_c0_g1_i1:105-1667(-)
MVRPPPGPSAAWGTPRHSVGGGGLLRPDSASSGASRQSDDSARGDRREREQRCGSLPPKDPRAPAARLPREGRAGGGKLVVQDPALLESVAWFLRELEEEDERAAHGCVAGSLHQPEDFSSRASLRADSPEGKNWSASQRSLPDDRRCRGSLESAVARSRSQQARSRASPRPFASRGQSAGVLTGSCADVARPKRTKSAADLQRQHGRLEATREKDRVQIEMKVQHEKSLRDQRFGRMFDDVMGYNPLRAAAARKLREHEDMEEERQRNMHAAWDSNVYQPVAQQAAHHMHNGRALRRQDLVGPRRGANVGFQLPGSGPKISVNSLADPLKADLIVTAQEDRFDDDCAALGYDTSASTGSGAGLRRKRCCSAPALRGPPVAPGMPRPAASRPVLEPTDWAAPRLQGTAAGSSIARGAEMLTHSGTLRRARRGGDGAHLPDEADGISSAGKVTERTVGKQKVHGTMGTLLGSRTLGIMTQGKTREGASSGAPAQDHFNFPLTAEAVQEEFPLGKKCFPGHL